MYNTFLVIYVGKLYIYIKIAFNANQNFMTYITKQGNIYEYERFLRMNSNYNEEI